MPGKFTPAIQPDQFTTFGHLLRFLRQRAGLTQRELSIAVGYSESQISRLENNQRAPDQATLAARFVPAVGLEYEPEWAARLLALGAVSRVAAEAPPASDELTSRPEPAAWIRFIGRASDLAEVKQRLRQARLVTLTGSGGCGKTRLALQALHDVRAEYPAGVWWLELARLTEPGLLIQFLATALGVREEPGQPLLTTLTDFLRPRRGLLALDNCEHLVTACAQLAETLLRDCPHLRLLATSREVLGVEGESAQRVPSLSAPQAGRLPDLAELARLEAVQLFVERAAAVRPGFSLTPHNAPAVAQICQRLDGIPLALELAANRVKVLSVEQIAARLDDSFHLLTDGGRAAWPRQQTLRAAMDWSHSLLTEPEARLFRRLAVFSGDWSLEAAETVCVGAGLQAAEVLDLLARLVDKSLVLAEERNGVMRYRRLETIRQYSLEKLQQSGEEAHFQARHLDFYLRLAEQAEPGLDAGRQTAWHARLAAEHDNLRAALDWACQHQPETARWLAGLLRWYWIFGDYLTEARAWYARVLGAGDPAAITHGLAWARQGAGMAAAFLYLFGEACAPLEKSAEMWRQLGDQPRLAECLWVLGYCYSSLGQDERACELFAANEPLFRLAAAPSVLATALGHWSMALVKHKRDFASARLMLDESLALARVSDNPSLLGSVFMNLGFLSLHQGDYTAAGLYYRESLFWRREAGTRWLVVASLQHMADALYMQNDFPAAEQACAEALELTRAQGDRLNEAAIHIRLGLLAANTGRPSYAAECFAASLEIARARFYPPVVVHSALGYAHLLRLQGRLEVAVRLLACIDTYLQFSQQSLLPVGQIEFERGLAQARAQLPAAEFAAAWQAGQMTPMELALGQVLQAG